MLSKIAFLILGLIAEKPLNPYQMKKLFEKLDMNTMFPMSPSSVYATINGLVKKKYILGKKEKNGKMPEKTIYSITKPGEKVLKKTLTAYLGDTEKIFSEFDIAITLVCHLERESALKTLTKHKLDLEREIDKRKKQYKNYRKSGWMPYTGLLRRMHYVHKREAELKTIEELITNVRVDKKWNHYPVPILSEYALEEN